MCRCSCRGRAFCVDEGVSDRHRGSMTCGGKGPSEQAILIQIRPQACPSPGRYRGRDRYRVRACRPTLRIPIARDRETISSWLSSSCRYSSWSSWRRCCEPWTSSRHSSVWSSPSINSFDCSNPNPAGRIRNLLSVVLLCRGNVQKEMPDEMKKLRLRESARRAK